ncbi:MAG TPA: T9SS type A sorting domain-containing protein [Saprospiraceae bacterium]
MNRILSLLLILTFVLCTRNNGFAQSMIFSGDSIIRASCEKYLNSLDTIHVYNNTDDDLLVRWELVQFHLPHDGSYWLIFEPHQYGPFPTQGYVNIEARDTAWIIFYMYQDTFFPGDSASFQIKVFDPLDSITTSQTLTAIQYCPLQTNNAEPATETQLQVFPNPVVDDMIIKIPGHVAATSLILYSITGEVIRQLPLTDHEISMSRDGLPGGMYFVGIESHGRIVGIRKIIILE